MTAFICPCGEAHDPGETATGLIDRFGDNVRVATEVGTWSIPRIYIAIHGIRAWEIPGLAAQYGWPTDDGTPPEGVAAPFVNTRRRGRDGARGYQ